MDLQIDGYHLERCIEPEHPSSTISDPVYAGTDRTGGDLGRRVSALLSLLAGRVQARKKAIVLSSLLPPPCPVLSDKA